jgi:hypothetical protein
MEALNDNQFFRSLVIPKPLKSIKKNLRKSRIISNRRAVDDLIRDYVEQSTATYEKLADMMLEIMRSQISFEDPDPNVIGAFESRLKDLDHRFSYVDRLLEEMTAKDKNTLYRDYLREVSTNLKNLRPYIASEIKSKESWGINEALFLSYYDLYNSLLNQLMLSFTRHSGVDKSTQNILSILSFVYQVIIYAYVKEKLDPNVMLRRFSELRVLLLETHYKRSPARNDFAKIVLEISPLSE